MPGHLSYYFIETVDFEGQKGLGGGKAEREEPEQTITNFIGVSSIDEYTEKIKSLNGRVLQSKTSVPVWGYPAVCLHTEGNTFGLWEDETNAENVSTDRFSR